MSKKNYMGMLGLLCVTLIWGGGFLATDIGLDSFAPFEILTIRFFIATIFMGVLAHRHLTSMTKAEWRAGIVIGLFLFGGFALQIVGLQYTTISKNAFLTATNVVIVPFIAMVLYKKKVGFQSLLGAAMAILGAGVLSLGGGFSLGLGDGLTLLCAVCFAFQVFWTGEYVKTYRPEVLNFIQMLTAFVLSALGYLYLSLTTEPGVREITTRGIVGALYLGIASTGVAYLMQTACQRYVDETRTAIILSMESVFGTILSVIFLDERVTKRLILGSGLILAAVLVSEIKIKGLLQEEAPAE